MCTKLLTDLKNKQTQQQQQKNLPKLRQNKFNKTYYFFKIRSYSNNIQLNNSIWIKWAVNIYCLLQSNSSDTLAWRL